MTNVTVKDRIVAHRSAPDVYDPPTFDQMANRIEELEDEMREMALDLMAADGQAAEAYQAQLEAEDKLAKAVEALEKLARLGNGDRYGNSDGNMIARTTVAELKGDKQP